MEQYAFCKKMSAKGNLEMRTMFGRNMALIITKVNGFFYVNLYNNNPRNPGRCSLGWDEFQEMVAMKNVLEHLQPQFHNQQPSQQPQLQQQQQEQQQQPIQTTSQMTPPPPYTARPIPVLENSNKKVNTSHGDEPPTNKPRKVGNEENFDPLAFFSQL